MVEPDQKVGDPDYLAANIAEWTKQATDQRVFGHRAWSKAEPSWGIFAVPDSELGLLPADASGLRAIELGCGTGYVSAWLARRGARTIGLDPTASQLQIAFG